MNEDSVAFHAALGFEVERVAGTTTARARIASLLVKRLGFARVRPAADVGRVHS